MNRCEARWESWFGGNQCEHDSIPQQDYPDLVLCPIHLRQKNEGQNIKMIKKGAIK